MKYFAAAVSSLCLCLICACTSMQTRQPEKPPIDVPKKLAVPVGKNWQVVEEPPVLTNERNEQTLPLQREQSVQPPGSPPINTDRRKIETR